MKECTIFDSESAKVYQVWSSQPDSLVGSYPDKETAEIACNACNKLLRSMEIEARVSQFEMMNPVSICDNVTKLYPKKPE